ncbi:MAG: hypothetical protein RL141_530 [Candidatus Parcubacteria bacterium]|jgi:putative endonuclease
MASNLKKAVKATGRRGEELAVPFFVRRGYRVVAQNWSCRFGELDLVIQKGDELRIIEVKTRNEKARGSLRPYEAVTGRKLNKIGTAFAFFSAKHPTLPVDAHVDVLSVRLMENGTPIFQWIKDFG